ncbi:hypothetical protein DYB25_007808 [Aphanomyces astaci]|uniref:Uncharacterized protein n=1 Tax=Aphanomyces astaci TaxID=112090 RepID=A0A397DLZ4_APHAT|nr:hypothetical protein DYB36_009340 [Aphanomyces astaci]RHY12430.1 hypothetical protein DYB25_007808 [Aphanomyces astaci]RHY39667.1 hypothetical protein DYB34_009189 [Aphanomyces astaci]RHY64482.1 hypothetical protein DYB30_010212 [Aphanomyces astaci]RHY75142.1 hypothetical protein DYB38_008739 [Aphanomyces astaci]
MATAADARQLSSRRSKRRSAVKPLNFEQTVANVHLMHSNVTPSFRTIFLAPHQGLVEPVDDIVGTTDAKMLLLNGSSLWCAGWVRLNDDYLVRVEAIPALVVNLVCHTTFFLVYFFTLSIAHVKLPRRFKGLSLRDDIPLTHRPKLAKDDSDRKSTHVGSSRGLSVFEVTG